MISEKVELLGKDYYTRHGLPTELTLRSMPTATELDYVGAEDFDATMIKTILPKSVEEKIDFGSLLAIDYYWVCRCLRILSYGPYFTTNYVLCSDCMQSTQGELRVDLRTVACRPVPAGFNNEIVIQSGELIDFDKPLTISLLTINEQLAKDKDKMFEDSNQRMNRPLATVCYAIKKVNDRPVTALDNKVMIEKNMSAADYVVLKDLVHEKLNYGLQAGGRTICPKCGSHNGAFMALMDDRFFRPTVGDLRQWAADRKDSGKGNNSDRGKANSV